MKPQNLSQHSSVNKLESVAPTRRAAEKSALLFCSPKKFETSNFFRFEVFTCTLLFIYEYESESELLLHSFENISETFGRKCETKANRARLFAKL